MISTTLWLSSDEARIFRFVPGQTEKHHMKKHGGEHHGQNGANHPISQDEGKFFGEVCDWILKNKTDRVLVIGPGPAKTHFKDYFSKHHAPSAKQIVAVEAMDKGTDGEIEDFAHRCFKKIDTFNS
jgi:stalled ribosome rescue protein Dom34